MRYEKKETQNARKLMEATDDIIREYAQVKNGYIVLGSAEYDAAAVLREIDPINYKGFLLDVMDEENIDDDDIDWDYIDQKLNTR